MRSSRVFKVLIVSALCSISFGISPAGAISVPRYQSVAAPLGPYSLENYLNSSYCLGISAGSDNAPARLGKCTLAVDQNWNRGLEYGTTGYYEIINGDGECLGVSSNSTAVGADIVGWQCHTSWQGQYWTWAPASGHTGYYNLVNLRSKQVLSVLYNTMKQGAIIVQEPNRKKADSQLWKRGPGSTEAIAQPSQNAWGGYSAYRTSGGYVNDVVASWIVPQVNCLSTPGGAVAIWAGLWGSADSYWVRHNAWLPQIGTESLCAGSPGVVPVSHLVWQMASQVPGGGFGPARSSYDCNTGDPYYNVCGTFPLAGNLALVNAGDRVTATVEYTYPYPATSAAQPRTFQISLVDDNTGQHAQGTMTTNMPVTAYSILGEGGAVVEDANGTLAKFASPLTINASVYGADSFGVSKWNLQSGKHRLIALQPVVITGAQSPLDYQYSVSWSSAK